MAGECITLSAVRNFVAKDLNRIVGSVARVLVRKAPYLDVLEGGTIGNQSDVVRSVVQEQAAMGSSLAAPVFVPDVTMCGQGGNEDLLGSTEYQYRLETLRGEGPRVCVKTSRTAFKGAYLNAGIALEKGAVKITNADIRYQMLIHSGIKFVARTGVSFDNLITGDAQAIDTKFYQALPNAPMNYKTLFHISQFLREDMLVEPFGTADGEFFKIIMSAPAIERIRNDADVKEDLLYLTAGSFKMGETAIAGYQFQGYRGLAFGIDSQPLRSTGFDGSGNLVLVEPEVTTAMTNGFGSRISAAWRSAPYEVGFMFGGNSFKRLTPEAYTGEGAFKFIPQAALGDLEWFMARDWDCNKYGDFGQHIYQISRAYQPIRPHAVVPFLYLRCPFDTGLGSCPTSVSGL